MVRATALIAMLLASAPAQAELPSSVSSGNDLIAFCGSGNGSFGSGVCSGFIAGVIERSRLQNVIVEGTGLICTPPDATNGQLRDVVLAFMQNHPATRHQAASMLVVQALQEAFCKK